MKSKTKENILITVSALRKIMEIFFGPFLIAYFIKTSKEGLLDLSIYNIITYFVIGVCGFIIAYIIRNKFQVGMFRIGIILNFVYILSIVILKEKILSYIWLVAFLYGVSAICYWFPYNLFISNKIENKSREEYEMKRKTASLIVSVATPLLLGGFLTTTDFYVTAIMIATLSFLQIILSFFIHPEISQNYQYSLFKSFKKLRKEKEVTTLFKIEFLKGFNLADGVLTVIVTVLIFNAFQTDMNLGLISSIASVITILLSYLYSKFFKKKKDLWVIILCSIIPVLCLFLLLLFMSDTTLILYYMGYNVLTTILTMIIDIRLFNISNMKFVKKENEMEFWAIREGFLNIGRILGYLILLFMMMWNKDQYLNYYLVFLTLTILVMGYFTTKVKKHNK